MLSEEIGRLFGGVNFEPFLFTCIEDYLLIDIANFSSFPGFFNFFDFAFVFVCNFCFFKNSFVRFLDFVYIQGVSFRLLDLVSIFFIFGVCVSCYSTLIDL